MPRDALRNFTRERIAHLAARLMAEDGIEDYALAKRKAARQAGASDTRHLPDNDEIDAALKLYRELYCQDHSGQLRELREIAVEVMGEFAVFNPYLTGSVLKGNAGKYARVDIHLYTDNMKGVELFLVEGKIEFRSSEARFYAGDRMLAAPSYTLDRGGIEVRLTVLSPRELRTTLKTNAAGKPIERAKQLEVEMLLAEE